MHCCARSNEQTGPGQRLALFFLALLGIGQSLGISFTCLEISELSLFDPLIIGTGKLYLTDDNGWLYSLCDAIRQRYIFRLQWSYISILSLPLTRHSSPYTKQPIYLHSIPIERPEKKINRPINQFKLHPTSKHTIRTTRTRSHPIPTYQRKSLSSRIYTLTYQPTPKQCLTQLLLSPQPLLHQVHVSMIST